MDRALGAISTGTTAATTDQEAVNRFGMMYQWGRKDPFTPATHTDYISSNNAKEVQIYNATGSPIPKGTNGIGTADEEFKLDNTITTTINHLIQNPSTHYGKGHGDFVNDTWTPIASTEYYNITKEGDWWNPTIKTLYDPCPNGYRIPKLGTYGQASDWIKSNPYSGLISGYMWSNDDISFFPASGLRNNYSGQFWGVGTYGYTWMSTPYNPTNGYHLRFSSGYVYPNTAYGRSDGFPARCIKD